MKGWWALLPLLFGPSVAKASVSESLRIDSKGYHLDLAMDFKKVAFPTAVAAFRSGDIMARISPAITSIERDGNGPVYRSHMKVKSFGMTSELNSTCQETLGASDWSRTCQLDPSEHMVHKSESVSCKEGPRGSTHCSVRIQGQMKPLMLAGITLLSREEFAARAKFQSLENYFTLYEYIRLRGVSLELAQKNYEASPLKGVAQDFLDRSLHELKRGHPFTQRFVLEGE